MTIKVDEHGLTVQAARPYSAQTLTISGTSAASTAFTTGHTNAYTDTGVPITAPNNTTHVRVVATTATWLAFGAAPVSVVNGAGCILLPAMTPEYFWVSPGEKISGIQDAVGGFLNIAELVA